MEKDISLEFHNFRLRAYKSIAFTKSQYCDCITATVAAAALVLAPVSSSKYLEDENTIFDSTLVCQSAAINVSTRFS
jgi:hypothetical protein